MTARYVFGTDLIDQSWEYDYDMTAFFAYLI